MFRVAADGTGDAELIYEHADRVLVPQGWSAGGGTLVFNDTAGQRIGISTVTMGSREWPPLLDEAYLDFDPAVSPDGRWLAYGSGVAGTYGIYIRPYPNIQDGIQLISPSLARHPMWSRDGGELFYRTERGMFSVTIESTWQPGPPEFLFENIYTSPDPNNEYDVAEDGRFLMVKGASDPGPAR